jgi:formylglycine-generating enzyme required for sulfatase activity
MSSIFKATLGSEYRPISILHEQAMRDFSLRADVRRPRDCKRMNESFCCYQRNRSRARPVGQAATTTPVTGMLHHNDRRPGVARTDLLILGFIVLLLSSLLWPAVESARESARVTQCRYRLGAIGTALQGYHDVNRILPPAAIWSAPSIDTSHFLKIDDTVPMTYQNWACCILPFLDHNALSSQFTFALPIIDQANASARNSDVNLFHCPSDSYNRPDNPYVYKTANGDMASFARGNYAINGGSQTINLAPGSLRTPLPDGFHVWLDQKRNDFKWWGLGVAGINKSFAFDDFRNGLSTTVMVDESRAGIHAMDPRGVWALGQIGGSITWAHGIGGDAVGPNPTLANADDILGGKALHKILGSERISAEGMTFCDHCTKNEQASARSQHPHGVNVLLADGAVRFITDDINPSMWHVMHSRETPRSILEGLMDNAPLKGDRREREPRSVGSTVWMSQGTFGDGKGREVVNALKMRFRYVPSGRFVMGLPDVGNASSLPVECPAHPVIMPHPILMGVHEVTQLQFGTIMGRNPSWFRLGGGGGAELATRDTDDCPVENVTWDEAAEFCERLNHERLEVEAGRTYRLPTEAEWEYCCRSGSAQPFNHVAKWLDGDNNGEFGGKQWTDRPLRITRVGSYGPNEFGLYDMRGNVWEWCSDWFCRDYYLWSSSVDPQGPSIGFHKVFRGTDWMFSGDKCKTRSLAAAPWERNPFIGFRVVCELKAAQK